MDTAMILTACRGCGRAGDELGQCGASLTCPMHNGDMGRPITSTDVVLECEPCGITRVMDARKALQGTVQVSEFTCPRGLENCACRPRILSADEQEAAMDKHEAPEPTNTAAPAKAPRTPRGK